VSKGKPNKKQLSTWNNLPHPGTVKWEQFSFLGDDVGGVIKVDYRFFKFLHSADDDQMPRAACGFWKDFAGAVTLDGGYTLASRP
jgi:hypothetical protein